MTGVQTCALPIFSLGGAAYAVVSHENVTELRTALDELQWEKDRAVAATEAKSSFLSTMSHEIRTPMNGVIGMTGILLETELTSEQREYAEIVRKSGESLLELINDILIFSKIEAGKIDLETYELDLINTVEDITEILSLCAADKGLDLYCQIDPVIPMVLKGDAGRVRQVLTNLVGNAIKFTDQGEIIISASLIHQKMDSVFVRFDVSDTGIGIPADRLDAIFSPFTQADGSTARKYGGTGLGLSISKQLVELMGGEIGATSVEGKGSTFMFTVRFETVPTDASSATVHAVSTFLKGCAGVGIMVVSGNATLRRQLESTLTGWGCRCSATDSAEEALLIMKNAATRQEPYRLALIDRYLRDMDDRGLGWRMRNEPLLDSVRLIKLSLISQKDEEQTLKQIGFDGKLTKPVRQSHLRDCIATSLGKRNARPTPVPRTIAPSGSTPARENSAVNILLAEDNIINQKVALKLLKQLGYNVDVANDGYEAVHALETADYDLVLMDCMMPEMDGYDATLMIRSPLTPVRNHHVPIIALTANAMSDDRDYCFSVGMNDYLTKPVRKQQLLEVITKWLNSDCDTDSSQERESVQPEEKQLQHLFDRDEMLDSLDGDHDVFTSIIELAIEELPHEVAQLKSFLNGSDSKSVQRSAHTIKGSASNLCTKALHSISQDIEMAAKNNNLLLARELMSELETITTDTMLEIKNQCGIL